MGWVEGSLLLFGGLVAVMGLGLPVAFAFLLPELFLRRRDQPEVMLCVLIVVFGRDRITGALRIARELDVFLCDVGGRAANFHIGAVGLVNPCQRILALAAMTAAAPHALLTVSHGVSVRQPLIDCGLRRDLSNLKVPRAEAIAPRPAIRQTLFANPAADQSRGGTHKCVVISCVEAIPMPRFSRRCLPLVTRNQFQLRNIVRNR